ncbi:MAG: hypothetical protein ACREV3_01010 [Gammaproteobacteria bacterium]
MEQSKIAFFAIRKIPRMEFFEVPISSRKGHGRLAPFLAHRFEEVGLNESWVWKYFKAGAADAGKPPEGPAGTVEFGGNR